MGNFLQNMSERMGTAFGMSNKEFEKKLPAPMEAFSEDNLVSAIKEYQDEFAGRPSGGTPELPVRAKNRRRILGEIKNQMKGLKLGMDQFRTFASKQGIDEITAMEIYHQILDIGQLS